MIITYNSCTCLMVVPESSTLQLLPELYDDVLSMQLIVDGFENDFIDIDIDDTADAKDLANAILLQVACELSAEADILHLDEIIAQARKEVENK